MIRFSHTIVACASSIIILGVLSCGRVTGTIDDPYHILYVSSSKQGNYIEFKNSEIRFRHGGDPYGGTNYPITNSTKSGFDIAVTAPRVSGQFVRLKEKGCEGNPAAEYKEVILYNLTLQFHTADVTTETFRGEAGCE